MLAHIQTDKPVYKSNDVMFVEVYLVDPITKKPLLNQRINAILKIKDSFDEVIFTSQTVTSESGTLVFTYKVPEEASGGIYKIEVSDSQRYYSIGFTKSMRKFRVDPSLVEKPELFVTADFDKENYFPG